MTEPVQAIALNHADVFGETRLDNHNAIMTGAIFVGPGKLIVLSMGSTLSLVQNMAYDSIPPVHKVSPQVKGAELQGPGCVTGWSF